MNSDNKSRRTTIMPAPAQHQRPSIQPYQQQLSERIAGLQTATEHYLGMSLTSVHLTSPFQHASAVQSIIERIVYEIILNQTDVSSVLSEFSTYACLEAVGDKLNVASVSIGKLHHEFARGFLICGCIDYVLAPLRALMSIPTSDWFYITEPPGSFSSKSQIEKLKATYTAVERKKIDDQIRDLLDLLLLVACWYRLVYDYVREELDVKCDEQEIMDGVMQEIAAKKNEKLMYEEMFKRDDMQIVGLESQLTELQNKLNECSKLREQLGKQAAVSRNQIAAAEEAFRQQKDKTERTQRRLCDLEKLVVKNPDELKENYDAVKKLIQKTHAVKDHKQNQITEMRRQIEAHGNYASDLRQATTLARTAFERRSVEDVRKQRYTIERELIVVKSELDGLSRTFEEAELNADTERLEAAQQALHDQELKQRAFEQYREQYELNCQLNERLVTVQHEASLQQKLYEQLQQREDFEHERTEKLEEKLRDGIRVLQKGFDKICAALAQRYGLF